jgi:hypothetical protein
MKSIAIRTSTLGALILSLFAFFACDSKYTLIEAFLQNGAETKLFTYTAGYSSNFRLGQSVSISGDVALIGGRFSAYLYRWDGDTWTKDANLTNRNIFRIENSVALSEIRAVVGGEGSVSVYRFNGSQWQKEAELTTGAGATGSEFGNAVSMSERVIAVGANDNDFRYSPQSGFVSIYRLNGSNWVEEAKLAASSGKGYDGFGSSVCVNRNVAIVGAWGTEPGGMAYVYRFTGSLWKEEAKLTASDANAGDQFGRAVAVSGDVAIVGAPFDDENIANAGSAYIFRYNGSSWRQEAKLSFKGTTPSTGAYFGSAIAVDQNVAIIGAPFYNFGDVFGNDDSDSVPGTAYVYRWDGTVWREQKILTASDGTSDNRFGAAVSISGRLAIVGAPNKRYGYTDGAAYVYVLD